MSEPTVIYAPRHDTSPGPERAALANVYRLVIDSARKRGRLLDKSGPEDAKGSKHDRARDIIPKRS